MIRGCCNKDKGCKYSHICKYYSENMKNLDDVLVKLLNAQWFTIEFKIDCGFYAEED